MGGGAAIRRPPSPSLPAAGEGERSGRNASGCGRSPPCDTSQLRQFHFRGKTRDHGAIGIHAQVFIERETGIRAFGDGRTEITNLFNISNLDRDDSGLDKLFVHRRLGFDTRENDVIHP